MDRAIEFLVRHGAVVLTAYVFAEQFGFPVSSVPLLMAAGALAAAGKLGLSGVIVFPVAASVLADSIWFEIGKLKGSSVLNLLCRISLEPDSCVRNTENLFARQGANALVVAKYVPGLSTVAPPLAGMFGMPVARFFLFDGLGAIAYIGGFVGLGYIFSRQIETIAQIALSLGTWLVVLLAAGLVFYIGGKYLQRRSFLRKLRISRIAPEELKRKLDAGENVAVVDLRHSMDFESNPTTIPGAVFLPSEEFEKRYSEIPRDRELILFCT
jgi:membrane protein DedA with SNARE-associated domain